MGNKKILLGLTTTWNSDWREKIKEISEYNIKEIALFLTCLKKEERQELYALLEKTCLEKIPHVHLRSDMETSELDYLVKRWNTDVFNIHPEKTYPIAHDWSKYSQMIFVENSEIFFDGKNFLSREYLPGSEDLKKYGGICFDFAHREDFLLKQEIAEQKAKDEFAKMLENYRIGCCHISVIKDNIHQDAGVKNTWHFSHHEMNSLKELGYIKKYMDFLPDIISIELENSFEEQLKAKKYLEEMISNKK